MEGWINDWTDGQMDGQGMERQINGQVDGLMYESVAVGSCHGNSPAATADHAHLEPISYRAYKPLKHSVRGADSHSTNPLFFLLCHKWWRMWAQW